MKTDNTKLFQISYLDIAESEELRDFFLIFSELAGIHFRGISNPHHTQTRVMFPLLPFNPLCTLIRSVPEGFKACKECDRQGIMQASKAGKPVKYFCHAGLVDFGLPIMIDNQLAAITVCGQIMVGQPSEEGFLEFAKKISHLNLDEQQLKDAYFQSTYLSDQRIEAVLRGLTFFINYFNEIGSRLKSVRLREDYPELYNVKNYLCENFRENISFNAVAKQAGLSLSYCSRLFSRVEGKTLTQYLRFLRLTEAKKLLRQTDLPVMEIALKCGFNDLSCFNKSFHASEGCSPRDYRKSLSMPQS